MQSEDTCLPVDVHGKLQGLRHSFADSLSLTFAIAVGWGSWLVGWMAVYLEKVKFAEQRGEERGERRPGLGLRTFTLLVVKLSPEKKHP